MHENFAEKHPDAVINERISDEILTSATAPAFRSARLMRFTNESELCERIDPIPISSSIAADPKKQCDKTS